MEYEGDASITTNCGVSWNSNVAGGSSGINQLIFTASPHLDIPANTPTLPGFCFVRFDVKVLGLSTDKTPNETEELVGYDVAQCDNGVLLSGSFQTSSITTPSPLHFSCYEVPRGNMPDVTGLSLIDRFGSTTASAIEVKRICAPTDKNNEDPTAVAAPAHLTAFTVVTTGGSFSKPKNGGHSCSPPGTSRFMESGGHLAAALRASGEGLDQPPAARRAMNSTGG